MSGQQTQYTVARRACALTVLKVNQSKHRFILQDLYEISVKSQLKALTSNTNVRYDVLFNSL